MTTDEATLDVALERLVNAALSEDVGSGDWTTRWTVEPGERATARVATREWAVISGMEAARRTFELLDPDVEVEVVAGDATEVEEGDTVLRVEGLARALLGGERTALNFLARLSGIATLTRRFVTAVRGTGAEIVDTRKTTPGWRRLEKAAVRHGGGVNHRMGLYDMVLVKENHVTLAGGLAEALGRIREGNESGLPVEVEVRTLDELDIVLDGGVSRILLDNMEPDLLRDAVERARASDAVPVLEASGNITLSRAAAVAETGVDRLSVGALTHSAPSVDFSLLVDG